MKIWNFITNSGDEASVERLLKSGADVNHKDEHKRTALHIATLEGLQQI